MTDLPTIQALINAHKAAEDRWNALPDEVWPEDDQEMEAAGELVSRTAAALCAYRPTTLEGVHLKAGYMMTCSDFVGGEGGEPEFTHAQLVSGFLPVGAERS